MSYPAWILDRSFGGLGVAVSPVNGALCSKWPTGKSSPMSLEACQAIIRACSAREGLGPAHMVFLVGGAGNGKSRLAAEVVRDVRGKRKGEDSAFAQRSYEFVLPNGRALRVLNDATIPPADKHASALRRDISGALRGKEHFLGCINRGVLIGEQSDRSMLRDDHDKVASDIVGWLLNGETVAAEDEVGSRLEAAPDLEGSYLYANVFLMGELAAVLHLVYMDSASLLEEWHAPPAIERTDAPLPTHELQPTPLLDPRRAASAAAFEPCLSELSGKLLEELDADELDPIAENARSLSNDLVARGWCSMMRGAEILSGTHFSYRELWALSVHSLFGPASSDTMAQLIQNIAENLSRIQSASISDRVSGAVSLGSLRTHMMLFEAGAAAASDEANAFKWPRTTSDAIKSIHLADPVKHFGPTNGSASAKIDVALDGLKDGQCPGAELASSEAAIGAYWGKLDARIEQIIREAIDPGKEAGLSSKQRNQLLSWYGRYLYRLVALVRGWPAYVSIVSDWQEAWLDAHHYARLDPSLEEAVLDIIAPVAEGAQKALFTFLQPRVTQGEANAPKVRIEIPRNEMNLSARVVDNRIDLEIRLRSQHDGYAPATTSLDFHLLREATAGLEGHGFTDSRLIIEPRIERLRAAMVAAQIRAGGDRNRFNYSDRNYDETK